MLHSTDVRICWLGKANDAIKGSLLAPMPSLRALSSSLGESFAPALERCHHWPHLAAQTSLRKSPRSWSDVAGHRATVCICRSSPYPSISVRRRQKRRSLGTLQKSSRHYGLVTCCSSLL